MDKQGGVEQAETNQRRCFPESVAAVKAFDAGGIGIDGLFWQHAVEQLANQSPAGFYELTVHTWNIELAQIQAKAESDIQVEMATSRINAEQQAEGVENEVNKGIIEHRLEMEKIAATASSKITEARAVAEVKNIPKANSDD